MTEPGELVIGSPEPTRIQRTFCRICGSLCGLLVTVRDDEVLEVRPDPEHLLTRGYTCSKGRALGAMHHRSDRLDRPRVRRDDTLEETTWNECLDDLAARIQAIRSESGPDAFGLYTGTFTFFDSAALACLAPLVAGLGTRSHYSTATVDAISKMMVQGLVAGDPYLFGAADVTHTPLLLLVGTNPVVSHGAVNGWPDPVRQLREVARRGELWVIDPRISESAALATGHLRARVGTDHEILAYLVRELLRDGADWEYIDRYVAGVDELRDAVEPFDLERVSRVSGVPADPIQDLLAAIRRAGRVAATSGTGPQMSAGRNASELLIWALCAITGSLDREGGIWFNPGYFARSDRGEVQEYQGYARGEGPPSRPELPAPLGQFPCAALADEIEAGNLRGLLVIGGNPINALPQPDRLRAALATLEVLAVCEIVESVTVDVATHVLSCTGQLEQPEVLVYDRVYPVVGGQYSAAVVRPVAERKPMWWVLAHLARRLGFDVLPAGLDPETATHDEVLEALVPADRLAAVRDATTMYIEEGPVYGWVLERGPLLDRRWQLGHADVLAELRDLAPPPTLVLVPRRQGSHMNSYFLPAPRPDEPAVVMHPIDASARGLEHGGMVEVRSEHGALVGTLSVSDAIMPGSVSVPHGYRDVDVGRLTSETHDVDLLNGMVTQSGIALEVSAVPSAPG